MSQKSIRRSLVLFVLSLVVLAGATQAAPLPNRFPGDLGSLWGRLESFFEHGLARQVKHGCSISPDGKPECLPTSKLGCSIDPNGQQFCPPTPKAGCSISPDGKPVCTP
jgi:hypothetical protein